MSDRAAPRSAVSLHIDRVVVDGVRFSAHEAARFRRAIEGELGRLAAAAPTEALARGAGAIPSLAAAPVALSAAPADLGRSVARSLFDALSRGR